MPSCFAPGCKSGYRNDSDHHFFELPRDPDEFKKWEQVLRHKDRRLTYKSKICERHFEVDDIVKYYKHIINGNEVFLPRGKWALAPGALPRLFPGLPERISKLKVTKRTRSSPKKRAGMTCLMAEDDRGPSWNQSSDSCDDASPSISDGTSAAPFALNEAMNVSLLSAHWRQEIIDDAVSGMTCGVFYCRNLVAGELLVQKTVIVERDGSCTINGYNKVHKQLLRTLTTVAHLESVLKEIDGLNICGGITTAENVPTTVTVHHKHCTVFTKRPTCFRCLCLRRQLRARKPAKVLKTRTQKVRNLSKKFARAAAAKRKKNEEILALKQKLCTVSNEGIEDALSELPSLQRLSFMPSLKQLKVKAACGMRYKADWILNCLMLRIASPRAYKLISDMKMLPLPSMSRLTQILKGIPCKYGFNPICLEAIAKQFDKKTDNQRFGSLILDEIKLRQAYDFNKSSNKIDGTNQLADHALVLMFVPMFEGWVQPIATFATKGAAPGKILAQLVLEAVIQLHKHGATVIAVVSDGAGNNRSMWQQLGVSGSIESPCHKISHPCLPEGNFLHFLCDVPHALKCVRNHLLKHKYGQARDNRINFKHYQILYETEKKNHLKVVPKLTAAHVEPSNLLKVSVRFAAQLFSRSTAIGLKMYREEGVEGLEDSVGTEAFTRIFNDVFDALNAKHPAEGIRKGSPQIQRIFGVVRSFHGDDDHPTIVPFSQIYRLLSLFTPVKNAVKGNCSGQADIVLVSLHESLGEKAKAAAEIKRAVEAKLH
ncbi:hypothetical protein HPB51_004932 [Rhipicephalus microplus]|uniref:THAP-type domain-containing protein n=1 Tax=Rhipicephalus microplus TaxID=6941 RepID=A0A9J6EG75_RHIMP|nr:hypothetical protein HPB51_004932 [Rhipicephalus microplus]